MADLTGDGINDFDITAPLASVAIGGAVFADAAKTGSGTGQYNTFLAIQDSNDAGDFEAGFNSDQDNSFDPSNTEIDGSKTHTVKLSSLVVTTYLGVQYYEFRVDLNEANSAPNTQISLDQFKLYSSTSSGIISRSVLQTQNKLYDLDAGGNVSVLLSEAGSSGSGTDDYAVLVPVSKFVDSLGNPLDPTTTYIYLDVEMGHAGTGWGVNGGFEEWNLQNGVTLTGVKFEDANHNGARDVGEAGIGGVTIFIDANGNGALDGGERFTTTAANGSYSFYGVGTNLTLRIDEVTPAGQEQTTGDFETVTIGSKIAAGSTITVDPIGNFIPHPSLNILKDVVSISGGRGVNGLLGADSAGDVVTYIITVQNTGNVPLTGITVADPNASSITPMLSSGFNTGDTNHDGKLSVGETWNYSATHLVTQAELDNNGGGDGDIDNVATADSNETDADSDDATALLVQAPSLNIVKAVSSITGGSIAGAENAGDVIHYAIDVQNTGNLTLTGLVVTDDNADGGTVSAVLVGGFNSGDTDHDNIFDVGETWHYTAAHTVTQVELDTQGGGDSDVDNLATADTNETPVDTATAEAPLAYAPSLNLMKSVAEVAGGMFGQADSAGDIIHYDLAVENTGNITLTGLSVTDDNADGGIVSAVLVGGFNSGDIDHDNVFDVGETWHYTAAHTVTQDELDTQGGGDSDVDNIATADSNETGPDTASAEVPLVYAPSLNLVKSVAEVAGGVLGQADDAGDVIHYDLAVENTGNVTLTGLTVTDDNADAGIVSAVVVGGFNSGDTDHDNIFDVGETWHYTAAHTVTQAELDSQGGGDSDVDNIATADSNETGPDTASAEVPLVYAPSLNIEKDVASVEGGTIDGKADTAGDIVNYAITVENTGNVSLTGITVSDPNADSLDAVVDGDGFNTGDTDQDGKLSVGETWNYAATHIVTQDEIDGKGGGDGDLDNIATVTSNETGPDSDDAQVPLAYTPMMAIDKAVDSIDGATDGKADSAGDTINYVIDVSNSGNIALTNISVSDPNADSITEVLIGGFNSGDIDQDGKLDLTETWHWTATHNVTQADLDSNGDGDGDVDNTATAHSTEAADVSDSAEAPLLYAPALNIIKDVTSVDGGTQDGAADNAGDIINYAIAVENTGNVTLTGIDVSDPNADSLTAVTSGGFNTGDIDQDGKLSVGETWHYTASHVVTQAELDSNGDGDGDIDNVATADSNETGPDSDDAEAPVVYAPALNIIKDVTSVDGGTQDGAADNAGDIINYAIAVENTGNVSLTGIDVSDPNADSLTAVTSGGFNTGDIDQDGKLSVGETWHYTASHVVTQAELDSNGDGDGDIDNVATADSNETGPDSDDAEAPIIYAPALNIIKDVTSVDGGTQDGAADNAGDIINYAIAVENTGNVTLTGIDVSDPNADSLTAVTSGGFNTGDIDQDGKLSVGETWHYTASHAVTQAELDSNGDGDGDIDNVATADSNETGPDSDDASAPLVYDPRLQIAKDVTAISGGVGINGLDGANSAGDVIQYALNVANVGNVSLTNISVVDPNADSGSIAPILSGGFNSGDANHDGALSVGETWHYTAAHTVTQGELDSFAGGDGKIENVATADSDESAPDSDDANAPVVYDPRMTIAKTVTSIGGGVGLNGLTGADTAGDIINYSVIVANTGNVTLTGLAVSDVNADTLNPVLAGAFNVGDVDHDGLFDVGESWSYTATHIVTQGELDGKGGGDGDVDNTAVADTNETAPVSADAAAPLLYNPSIDLEKYVSVDNKASWLDADTATGPTVTNPGTAWFKITLANTGNITLTGLNLTDLLKDYATNSSTPIDLSGATLVESGVQDGKLTVGETATLIYSAPLTNGQHTNTATITTAEGATDSDAANYLANFTTGPGVRTPGFWSNLGASFWDGVVGNEPKQAGTPGFAKGELLYAVDSNHSGSINGSDGKGLLVGDYNHNGLTDAGEDTLFISLADAKLLINASNSTMSDGIYKLGRDVVASWLNFLAGNGIGEASDSHSPKHFLNDAINWEQVYGGTSGGTGNTTETFDIFHWGNAAVKTSSSAWSGHSFNDHSGAQIHDALDYYNNHGQTSAGGTVYAGSADSATFVSTFSSTSGGSSMLSSFAAPTTAFLPLHYIDGALV